MRTGVMSEFLRAPPSSLWWGGACGRPFLSLFRGISMVGDLVGAVRGLDKPDDVRVLIWVVREGLARLRELDAGFGVGGCAWVVVG